MSTTSKKYPDRFDKFNEVLSEALRQEEISAAELTERLNAHRSSISRYLSDDDPPNPHRKTVKKMNSVLTKCEIIELENGWKLRLLQQKDNSGSTIDTFVNQDQVAYTAGLEQKEEVLKQILYARRLLDEAMEILLGNFPGKKNKS